MPGAIVSGFGYRTNPIGGGTGFHSGVDMAASYGTPIRACRAGKVVVASVQGGYGNAVVIDHGGGMGTLYGHQSSMAVAVGQNVAVGHDHRLRRQHRELHRAAPPLRGPARRHARRPRPVPLASRHPHLHTSP